MNKRSKFFWTYAIILFSVAFILILVSSFTVNRKQNELNEQSSLYQGAQQSLSEVSSENSALKDENAELIAKVTELNEKVAELNEEIDTLNAQIEAEKEIHDSTVAAYETLSDAAAMFMRNERTRARNTVGGLDTSLLGENGKEAYSEIRSWRD